MINGITNIIVRPLRGGKHQHAEQRVREGNPQQPWAKAPVFTAGTVGHRPHNRIGDGINNAYGKQQNAHQRRRETKNIRIKIVNKQHDGAEYDIASGVTHPVAYFFFN